ncbi:MAG: hypothetical protein QM528_09225 [Phycisphaerales bacterium]|nr:hypothetical protein [Phycisphaerales bacterium]
MNSNSYYRLREKQKIIFRRIYDLVMAILLLTMTFIMLMPDTFGLTNIASIDATFRDIFGVVCLLYGLFRLLRGIKKHRT